MKFLFLLLFVINILFAQDGEKKADVDFDKLFKQIDSAVSKKKKPTEEINQFNKIDKSNKEQKFIKFNKAAKKYHIYRAKKILVVLNKLLKQYEKKNVASIDTVRYARVGSKVFAYVSNVSLKKKINKLDINANILHNLYKHKELLESINDFDIKTIAKVLKKLEQEILNLNGLGKREIKKIKTKSGSNYLVKLRLNETLDNVEVFKIDKNMVKLRSTLE